MPTIRERVSLKPYNTLGFAVEARFFVHADSLDSLREAAAFARDKNLPLLLLGGGSNIVLTQPFAGVAVELALRGRHITPGARPVLTASAGENWHQLVQWSLQQQAFGLENLSLIPGTLGAAPIQNIGAYGVELRDSFSGLQAMQLSTGDIHHFSAADCQFGYRDSVFKGELQDQYAIVQVSLSLHKQDRPNTDYAALRELLERQQQAMTAQAVSDAVCTLRRSKLPDPAVLGNAGSFFKNPVVDNAHLQQLKTAWPHIVAHPVSPTQSKLAAGWLVEQAGFKGCTYQGVGVHEQQALVLVNRGTGTGQQLLALAAEIQAAVQQQFSVQLEIEPRIY
ncbi:MAG: UDP-N-acetylenolpyruvoylglucosamine reductase [Gammaproteobacteria bacterium]|nr:MAG: UDP-N-acetylenolpyruvoylglucosamine reductase [Gammaproteobacteria bacterium]